MGLYIVVNGLPGSGKSTLAAPLARRLGLPLISKDTIKDAFLAEFGPRAGEWTKVLGRASIAAMYAVAMECDRAVLDSFFSRQYAPADLSKLPGDLLEIYCRCPLDVARRRYAERSSRRHEGHDEPDLDAAFLRWQADGDDRPLGISPVLDVDTSGRVNLEEVAEWIITHSGSRRLG
ncbi:AAA family ATPase [Nonomuraea sp. NPDC050202]|jgi:predicted kinase|uniref:AAA family ATPase n=1 Tax=Nonomuraea sp. NPDC050202 TaxID=3155035 RepID=UPI0033C4B6DC